MKGSIDGYQYGLMYSDGSVARSWNGNTQERLAYEALEQYKKDYPNSTDNIRVVRRWIGPWEVVSNG